MVNFEFIVNVKYYQINKLSLSFTNFTHLTTSLSLAMIEVFYGQLFGSETSLKLRIEEGYKMTIVTFVHEMLSCTVVSRGTHCMVEVG